MSDIPYPRRLAGAAVASSDRKLSDVLAELCADPSRERIALADLLQVLRDRALGALLFIFAVPNVLPTPPGTSSVLGAPLIVLSAQLALGMKPWLPDIIARRSIPRADFAALVARLAPWLARVEGLLRPRLSLLARPACERGLGVVCFVLAVVLFLPIPLGNMLPALAISMMALGLLERDGLWIAGGILVAILSAIVLWGVFWIAAKTLFFILAHAL